MPSVTGSSSHPTGTAVGTYLFGPSAMPALALVTLVFQALLLAHGGLTTLGANLFSLGVVGPWAMWILLRLLLRIGWKRDRCIFLSTVVGDLATYVTTAGQLALAYPSAHGGYAASFIKFLGVFLITQIPISIAEGLLTVVLLRNLAADQAVGSQTRAPQPKGVSAPPTPGFSSVVFATMLGAFMYANFTKPLGSDDQAVTAIQSLRPGYHPIAKPLFIPSEALEPLLFTLPGGHRRRRPRLGALVVPCAAPAKAAPGCTKARAPASASERHRFYQRVAAPQSLGKGSVRRWAASRDVLRPAFSLVHRDRAGRNSRRGRRRENPCLELARRPFGARIVRPSDHPGDSDSDR